jgi:hypothetical protein
VVLAGTGGASLLAGGIAAGLAASRWSSARAACPGLATCPTNAGHDLSFEAAAEARFANAAFGLGASALVGSAILWAAAPRKPAGVLVRVALEPRGIAAKGGF